MATPDIDVRKVASWVTECFDCGEWEEFDLLDEAESWRDKHVCAPSTGDTDA